MGRGATKWENCGSETCWAPLKTGKNFLFLLFGDVVDNVHLEGTRNFDLSPSFNFMTKNR